MNLANKITQIFNWLKKIFSGFSLPSKKTEQAELDKKLVFSLSKSRWPNWRQLKYVNKYLNRSERTIISGCFLIIVLSLSFLSVNFYKTHLRVMPADGGDYVEAVIGSIKYLNPLYSTVSAIDSDITNLIYSSLFRRGENSELVNDLAQSWEASPDGKTYTVKIRPDAKWQSGGLVTADDLVFTFRAIKNPEYKSPLRATFTGVEIEKVDGQTVKFILTEPYAAFLDLLNFGILPQEFWSQIEPAAAGLAELNLKPIGSGRFKFKSLVKDKSGNIRSYNLSRHSDYYGGAPYLDTISFKFFGNLEEAIAALNNNLVNGLSYLPKQAAATVVAKDSLNFYNLNLPKLSAVFFNLKANPALADKKVRQALAYAIDKNKIINDVLGGDARVIDGPILPENFAYNSGVKRYDYSLASSTELLAAAGWKIAELNDEEVVKAEQNLTSKDEAEKKLAEKKTEMGAGKWLIKNNDYLIIELTTVDNQEYGQVARLIAEFWQAVNIKTKINLIPASQIQGDIIRLRNFSALFYSEITGADPDPYAFWHSSQIGQVGLNIADYANKEADKLLEEGRLASDLNIRRDKYGKFQQLIAEDQPAIFLYSPNYTYVQGKNIKGFKVKSIILPSDRFSDAEKWYIKTVKKIVW